MKLIFSVIIAILLVVLFEGCCPSSEITTITITERDTVFIPNPIIDSVSATDNGGIDLLYDFIYALQRENDSLMGVPARIEYRNSNPLNYEATGFKVNKGDSVFVTFRYKGGSKSFFWKVIPAKIHATLNDTDTHSVKQYEPTFFERLWTNIKNFILVFSLFANVILVLFILISKVKIPFID